MFFISCLQQLSKKIQDSLARANEVADEVCSSMRTVCSFAMERDEAKRYSERLQETYKLKKKEAITYGGYIWCSEVGKGINLKLLFFSFSFIFLYQYFWVTHQTKMEHQKYCIHVVVKLLGYQNKNVKTLKN